MFRKIILTVFISLLCYGATAADDKNASRPSLDDVITKAEAGNIKAQSILGFMYAKGRGVSQDYAKAVFWFQKAAEQSDAPAQYNLGVMYHKGVGVPRNYRKAFYWYQKADKQGHAEAQHNLGIMYAKGQGIQKNRGYAYVLASHAAANLEDAKELRDELEDRMTPKEIAKAQSLTIKDVLK